MTFAAAGLFEGCERQPAEQQSVGIIAVAKYEGLPKPPTQPDSVHYGNCEYGLDSLFGATKVLHSDEPGNEAVVVLQPHPKWCLVFVVGARPGLPIAVRSVTTSTGTPHRGALTPYAHYIVRLHEGAW